MASEKILVLGTPGSGKSTAIESLDPITTFVICCDKKGLPFKGWKKNYKTVLKDNGKIDLIASNYYESSNPAIVQGLIKAVSEQRPDIKVIIIDTITAMIEDEYMNRIKEKGFERFNDLALDIFKTLVNITDNLREDLTVIFLGHTETTMDEEGVRQTTFKVIGGKLIGEKITPESRFNYVLYSEVVMKDGVPTYWFSTQSNGKNTCRTSKGVFTDLKIPNDYKLVVDTIKKSQEE